MAAAAADGGACGSSGGGADGCSGAGIGGGGAIVTVTHGLATHGLASASLRHECVSGEGVEDAHAGWQQEAAASALGPQGAAFVGADLAEAMAAAETAAAAGAGVVAVGGETDDRGCVAQGDADGDEDGLPPLFENTNRRVIYHEPEDGSDSD